MMHRNHTKYSLLGLLLLGLTLGPLALPATAQSLESQPGYVDFQRFGAFSEDDLTVEVNLGGALLRMLATTLEDEEEEFARLLREIQGLRVNIFKLPEGEADAAQRNISRVVSSLKKSGWEAVVRIKDEQDLHLLILPSEDRIAGLLAVFADPGETIGFVNIVGNFDPEKIARLGQQLDLPPLSQLGKGIQDKKIVEGETP
jgi:hypothetical protein